MFGAHMQTARPCRVAEDGLSTTRGLISQRGYIQESHVHERQGLQSLLVDQRGVPR